MKQIELLTIGVILSIVGLFIANITLSAELSNQGIELKDLEVKASQLERANEKIERQLIEETALHDLKDKAAARGFTGNIDYSVLPNYQHVAYNQ